MPNIFQATTSEHYVTARALFVEYAEQLEHDLCFQHFADELETLPGAYAPPSGCLLLASGEEGWAGCVALRGFNATICEMKRLYIRPRFRRQGLGRRLAQQVVQRAREIGYERVVLDTLSSMWPARTLYHGLGFRETTPHYHNPIPGAVFYALDLTATPR